ALVPLRGERRSLRSTGFYPVDGEELSVGPGGAPVTQQARPAAAARIDPPRDLVSGFLHGPLGRHSTVLKGFALSKQVDRVFDVYQEMVMNNIPLNTVSFNTIMDACARGGMMDRVSDIFRDMEVQGIEPDIITYSTVVKGYCLAGNVDRAFSVLRDMSGDSQNDRRRRFAPDEIMYNSLLDGCAKQHRVEQALELLDEMRANQVAPSNYTLSILVKLLGRARRLLEAFNMVEDLCRAYSFRANVQVYTCLIQACVHNRQLQRAMKLHDTMIEEYRVDPDQKTWGIARRLA
ncbi:hypothetical protein FOZ62_006926, partial [Perkinsus olseni]